MVDTYASDEQCAQLGKTILACRVPDLGKSIPPDEIGVRFPGNHVPIIYETGEKIASTKSSWYSNKTPSIDWRVSTTPMTLRYLPQPSCTEIGFELTLQLKVETYGDRAGGHSAAIAPLLFQHSEAVYTLEHLQTLLAKKQWLTPNTALQTEELDAMRLAFNFKLNDYGLVCNKLTLFDDYAIKQAQKIAGMQHAKAQAYSLHASSQATRPAAPRNLKPSFAIGNVWPFGQGQSKQTGVPSLKQILQQDKELQTELHLALPKLAGAFRKQPWPQDTQDFAQQKALLKRMEYLSTTTGRLPELQSKIKAHPLNEATIRLLAAECKKASKVLGMAIQLVQETPPNYQAISERLDDIEDAISRRRQVWWNAA